MAHSERRPIDELVFEVFRLNARLITAGDAAVKEAGLTSARWMVLGAVAMSSTPMTVAQIARTMGLTRQAVQRLTNEMAELGLVELRENPRHARARHVALTATGTDAYDRALHRWRGQWTAPMEELLSDDEITETMKRLRLVRGILQNTARSQRDDETGEPA